MDGFPSGQREQTVNLPSQTSVVRIHPHPLFFAGMAELADALDSGSSEQYAHAGSSPVSRTKPRSERIGAFPMKTLDSGSPSTVVAFRLTINHGVLRALNYPLR